MIPILGSLSSAKRPPVTLANFATIGAAETSPTDASAEFRINTNGDLERRIDGGTWLTIQTWLDHGAVGDYDVKLTVTGGALTSGSESQLNCGSTRTWTVVETTNGVAESSCDFTFELFYAGDSTVLAQLTGRRLQANVEL